MMRDFCCTSLCLEMLMDCPETRRSEYVTIKRYNRDLCPTCRILAAVNGENCEYPTGVVGYRIGLETGVFVGVVDVPLFPY